jgi:hypothetical protein
MSARKRRAVGVDSRSQSAEAVPAEVAQRTWSIHPHGSGMLATMLTESLTMLAVVNSHLGTLIWLQLCSPQGVALFSFHLLSPRVYRPFTVVPVYGMSLTHAKRLRAMGCGFKGRLIRLFSLDRVNYRKMIQNITRCVGSKMMAAVRKEAAQVAEELCASGHCANAVAPLQLAVNLGHLPSRALMAWLLVDGREGVAKDHKKAYELAEQGARLGCHHCQGVLSFCYWGGCGCEEDDVRSLELARKSSAKGSSYGQLTLGFLLLSVVDGLELEDDQALELFRLAAGQGLDMAQFQLGEMYYYGFGIAEDITEAQRWYQLAATQGYPEALHRIALWGR